jgi:hypothetical protein
MTLIETHTHGSTIYQIYGVGNEYALAINYKHYEMYGSVEVARAMILTLAKEGK